MTARRVVVTGRGVLSPIACDWAGFADALRTGVQPTLAPFPGSPSASPPLLYVLPDGAVELERRSEPTSEISIAAARAALVEAGLGGEGRHDSIGLVMNTVLGPATTIESYLERLAERGPRASRPSQFVDSLLSMPGSRTGIELGLRGSTGVLGGSSAIELAFDWVRHGREDVVVAGGAEWHSAKCVRYYDELIRRDGHLRAPSAQAAAFIVLEAAEHTAERGAAAFAEVLGSGAASEPQQVSLPWSCDPDASALACAMAEALDDAGLNPADIDAVVLAAGDETSASAERAAIASVLGESARTLLQPKPQLGEVLAASGPLALLVALAQLDAGTVAIVNAFESGGNATSLVARVGQ
jgi:3-oxoacyl-[acyl-carrier-protein] synthase II